MKEKFFNAERILKNLLIITFISMIYSHLDFSINFLLKGTNAVKIGKSNFLVEIIKTIILISLLNTYIFIEEKNFKKYKKNFSLKDLFLITSLILLINLSITIFDTNNYHLKQNVKSIKQIILLFLAAIKEELLFRYFLKNIFQKIINNKYIIFFGIAIIFSFFTCIFKLQILYYRILSFIDLFLFA